MITQAYVYKRTNKFLWTFASYDEKEEVFSDRNVFPKGCIMKMEKIIIMKRETLFTFRTFML